MYFDHHPILTTRALSKVEDPIITQASPNNMAEQIQQEEKAIYIQVQQQPAASRPPSKFFKSKAVPQAQVQAKAPPKAPPLRPLEVSPNQNQQVIMPTIILFF